MSAVTLCFDIGGSYIKAGLFDPEARPLSERMRSPTPPQASPKDVLKILKKLAEPLKGYERISAGFPGVVKNGITYTATNLGKGWAGFALASALEKEFSVPVRVANDADVQGLAAVSGKGIELVLTFGTGVGSSLFKEGMLFPNLQLSHQLLKGDHTYEDRLGRQALREVGKRKWNKRILKMIPASREVFSWDTLYLGGGNSKHIHADLPSQVKIVGNEAGLAGGVRLWSAPLHSQPRRIAIASDHAGFDLKTELYQYLVASGFSVEDLGTRSREPVDYPEFAQKIGQALARGTSQRGILICGSGVGASVAACKIPGIRAAVCHDIYSAHQGVEHDDMNVLVLGARVIGLEIAKDLAGAFLNANFDGLERHSRRLAEIRVLERKSA